MMSDPGFQMVAQACVERVLNALPGGLLIAAVAWMLLRFTGRQKSGTRFAVWFCALLAVAALPFSPSLTSPVGGKFGSRSLLVLPASWATVIFSLWVLASVVALARIAAGLWKLYRLRAAAQDFAAEACPSACHDAIAEFQGKHRVSVCSSTAVRVPTVIGFFQPTILLPAWVGRELSAEELRMILLHENAHLQRGDSWTNFVQKLVRTVFFFHPAVWWIERELTLEREMACDDAVLAQTGNPKSYAGCLVSLAEKSYLRRGLALAQAAVGRARETSLRIARILAKDSLPAGRVFRPALGISVALGAISLVTLQHAPSMIAFHATERAPAVAQNEVSAPVVPDSVVQAGFREPKDNARALVQRTATPKPADSKRTAIQPSAVEPSEARVIPATFPPAVDPHEVSAPQLVFVMRTLEYDADGEASVHLSVLKVTLDGSAPQIRQEWIVRKL